MASRRSLPMATSRSMREISVCEGALALLGDARERGVQAEAGLDAGRDQVHGVGQGADDLLLPGLDFALEPHARNEQADGART